MRAEQAEFSAGRGRTLALVGLGVGRGGIEQGLQIPVTKAGDAELAAIDSFQLRVIVGIEGVDGSHALTLPTDTVFDRVDTSSNVLLIVDRSQRAVVSVHRIL